MVENNTDRTEKPLRDESGDRNAAEREAKNTLQDQATDLRRDDKQATNPLVVTSDNKQNTLPNLQLIDNGSNSDRLTKIAAASPYDNHQGAPLPIDGKPKDLTAPGPTNERAAELVKQGADPKDAAAGVGKPAKEVELDAAKTPSKDGAKPLTEKQEKDGKVQEGEGPFQVAARMLGKGASQEEKNALTKALKAQYNEETNNKDPRMSSLAIDRSLINNGNHDKIMARITDKNLHDSIASKLDKSADKEQPKLEPKPDSKEQKVEPKPKVEPRPEPKVEPKPEPKLEPKPEPKVEPKPEQVEKRNGPLGSPMIPVEHEQKSKHVIASVYSEGQKTASGRYFNPNEPTVAIKPEIAREMGLRFGDVVKISRNGVSTEAVYTDAGPFVKGRGIDLSTAVGRKLGITVDGIGVGAVTFQKIGREPDFKSVGHKKKH